jgi:hypothetical protein
MLIKKKVGRPPKYIEGIEITTITRSVPTILIPDIDKAINILKQQIIKSNDNLNNHNTIHRW